MSEVSGSGGDPLRKEALLSAVLDDLGMREKAIGPIGELLLFASYGCRRVGCLSPLPVPSRDRGAREPWRMAVAALFMLGEQTVPVRLRSSPATAWLTALRCGLDCSFTSSASCLFGAAAGLLGVDSPAALEDLAKRHGPEQALPWAYCVSPEGELDFLPLLEDLIATEDVSLGAALFLATLAEGLAEWIVRAAAAHGARRVALWGDCLGNQVLLQGLRTRLDSSGIEICQPREDAKAALVRLRIASRAIAETSL